MTQREYIVALCSFVPIGPRRYDLLIKYFGNAKAVWTADRSRLLAVGLGEKLVSDFGKYREN